MDEEIPIDDPGEDGTRTISRLELAQIIEARMRETYRAAQGAR